MANPKIPQGYQGTYGTAADGSSVLIMVSRNEYENGDTTKKEHKPMASNKPNAEQMTMPDAPQPAQGQYVPYTTEQKREYAKQFTPREIASYRKGQQSAYGHMGNIGKRNSMFIYNNLQRDGAATPPPAAPPKPASGRKKNNGNK